MARIAKSIPAPIRRPLERLWYAAQVFARVGGVHPRKCTCCGFTGRFIAYGHPPRYDARCPSCGSLERHRLLVMVLKRLDLVKSSDRLIHFAPEQVLMSFFRDRAGIYETADIRPGRGDLVIDIENIDLEACSIDVAIINHVLEHVNDHAALKELYRVLRPGGRLVVTVPLIEGWETTYENGAVLSDEDRNLHFGQSDHVRYYGRDLRDRIKAAGFELEEYTGTGEESVLYSIMRGERVFVAQKRWQRTRHRAARTI